MVETREDEGGARSEGVKLGGTTRSSIESQAAGRTRRETIKRVKNEHGAKLIAISQPTSLPLSRCEREAEGV